MEQVAPKSNFRVALGVFGRTTLAAVISVFLYLSISSVFNFLSTEDIGYALWQVNDDGSTTLISEHFYTDEDYSEEGELKDDQMVTRLYSKAPPSVVLAADITTLVGSIAIFAAFPYRFLWDLGYSDRNAVNCGNGVEKKYRGLHIGLIADIPAMLIYALLWLGKLGVPWLCEKGHSLYALFNSSFMPYTNRITGTELTSVTDLAVWQMLLLILPVLVLPLVTHVAYRLGYREYIITDKLFYKNKKKKKRRRR